MIKIPSLCLKALRSAPLTGDKGGASGGDGKIPAPDQGKPPGAEKPPRAAWQYTKRVARDALILMTVVVVVSAAQSMKWQGRALSPAVFAKQVVTLDGQMAGFQKDQELLLLYVFAPWCQVCHINADLFSSHEASGYGIQGVATSYESVNEVTQFAKETGFKPRVLISDEELDKALAVNTFPTFLVVSKNGEILTGWSGYTTSFGLWIRMLGIRFFASHILN